MNTILIILSILVKFSHSHICDVCQNLVKEFHSGLKDSEKGNFGGGNTAWEEKRLGNFATSETRLVHILEGLCPSSVSNRDKCQYLREELEEHIEKWWFDVYRKDGKPDSLYSFLCVDHLKTCCHNYYYGKNCDRCIFYNESSNSVCSGHGQCSGNGTRDGDGTCICDKGYTGEICNTCSNDFYLNNDETCQQCHKSCASCTGDGSNLCTTCNKGYQNIRGNCEDINECNLDSTCDQNQFCINSEGSYECQSCHASCNGCTGAGSDLCISCNVGYQIIDGKCDDINECSADSQLCRDIGQKCTNTAGSYTCDCLENYRKQNDGSCKIVPIPIKTPSSSSTNNKGTDSNLNKKSKNKRQAKKIWTKKFEREFFKLILSVIVLGLVSYFLGRHSIIVVIAAIACGYYVYFKSIKLDQIFSRSFYV